MYDGKHHEVAEIDRKCQFGQWKRRLERPILTTAPRLPFVFNSVLGRSREIRLVINHRLDHCSRVVERQTNSQCKQKWQKKDLFDPLSGMQFPLGADVEKANGSRCCQENRNVY